MALEGGGAIITGAGSGMGRATALMAAEAGARVLCVDVAGAEATVAESSGHAHALHADVSNAGDWERIAETARSVVGDVFLLANIAGVQPQGDTVIDQDEASWDRVLGVNLKGVWLGMRAVIPGMLERGEGRIVNVASLAAEVGLPGLAAYTASKAGVAGLTRQAAVEYAPAGLRINALAPGMIETPMIAHNPPEALEAFLAKTPAGRPGQPEEIAAIILFLAGPGAGYITGETISVDGGWGIRG
jgi:NAD(P)-dependent dehydrogenase (short-subunit alcohol dehydrogenase family)